MKKIAVFASGNGGNFEAIVLACRRGETGGEVAVCICDRPGAPVIGRAARLGVPVIVASPGDFASKEAYEEFLAGRLRGLDIDLVCLAGYMRIVGPKLLEAFRGRILNIHPSLLPAFKGARALRDAFRYGVKVYGVTVHFVDETLDGGPIIDQEGFRYDGTDFGELERRIHEVEHVLYPRVIKTLL